MVLRNNAFIHLCKLLRCGFVHIPESHCGDLKLLLQYPSHDITGRSAKSVRSNDTECAIVEDSCRRPWPLEKEGDLLSSRSTCQNHVPRCAHRLCQRERVRSVAICSWPRLATLGRSFAATSTRHCHQ